MAGLSKLWGAFEVGVMVLLMDYLDEIFQPLAERCGHVLAEVVTAAVGKEESWVKEGVESGMDVWWKVKGSGITAETRGITIVVVVFTFPPLFLGATLPFFPLPSGIPCVMALEKLMLCLPLFVRTSQLMNSFIRLNFANTAIVCLQSDDALNPGQPEQSVLPLGKIFTIWGFRGSDEDATTNMSLDWFVIASGVVIRVIALLTIVETSARGIQSMPP